jgi:hypothetical protein
MIEKGDAMVSNLFVTYRTRKLGRADVALADNVARFGDAVQLHESLWYLRSPCSAAEVAESLWPLMDPDDCLVVIDSTSDTTAWFNIDRLVAERVERLCRT